MKKLLSGAGAALAAKIATGFAIAAIASTAAVAATEISLTGSANPANWGQQVKQTVETCKETLRASGTRGIGQCVSAFANQHGKTESADHSANGNANGHAKDKGDNGKHLGQSNDHANSHATGHKPDTTTDVETND
jgi:hypothetical protein